MSTHLLETGIDDHGIVLADHIAQLLDGGEQASALANSPGAQLSSKAASARDDPAAFVSLLLPHVPLLLQKGEPQDTETCLHVLCHLVASIPTPQASLKLALQLCDALAAEEGHREGARVAALLELFNTMREAGAKLAVLQRVLAYARATKCVNLAPSLHNKAEAWQREWGLDVAQTARVFTDVAAVLDLHPNAILKKEAFSLRSRVLLEASSADNKALREVAHSAVLSYIGNPSLFVCDLFAAPAVQALKSAGGDDAAAFELLSLMLEGDIQGFKAGSFDNVVSAAGTTAEACIEKMRMVALVALCRDREGTDVPFSEVDGALELGGADAEAWLVRAFGALLIDGRIDQVQEAVHVRRCERTVFGDAEWKRLRDDLGMWNDNLKAIEVMMKEQTLLTPTSTVQRWLSS